MNVIFMGTPDIAATVLEGLLETEAQVIMAVTQPDKKTGRKQVPTPSPVKVLAQKHGIPVFQPEKIKTAFQPIVEARPDLIITCAYGQIVPQEVLEAPRWGCVNLHGSLLPEYRGGAPIQRAIWDGKTKSGMTLMKMEAGLDTGPVCAVEEVKILPEDNSGTVFAKMGQAASALIQRELDHLPQAAFVPQDADLATYAPIIQKEEERLDLDQEDERIFNQVRALAPAPGAWLIANGKKLKVLEAQLVTGIFAPIHQFYSPGKGQLGFQLKDHGLLLKKVQLQGKPVMDIKAFMNGQGRSLPGTLGA